MTWQAEVGSGSGRATDNRDFLTKLVAIASSKHVATVAVNAGGSGYVVGDELTLTHASAYLDARFEVTSVSAGVITGLRINSGGAFAIRATSATVSAGGSGYAVGDILEVQGGTAREKGKFQVATLSGSAVATVTLFETGGSYSSSPSNPAATVGIGPSTFAGNDACTLTVTYSSLIGTTGLSVTGGSGSSATVDITLADTGWTVERNTNNRLYNSIDGEKEVVLVGDATGKTNKPYIGFGTFTQSSGINQRPALVIYGMITHNPALSMASQVSILGDPGTWSGSRPYLLCDENTLQEMDFWVSMDDSRICGVFNTNSGAASTDNGEYQHFYAGFMDTYATESENPYPYFVGSSARANNIDPSAASTSITGLSEVLSPASTNSGMYFWRVEDSSWQVVINTQSTATTARATVILPLARLLTINGANDVDRVVAEGPLQFWQTFGTMDRSSPSKRIYPIPGSTPEHFPIPLTVVQRPSTSLSDTLDLPRGVLRGAFFIYNTDSAGATITNLSEDYVTIGNDRYRIFHTHVHKQLYHFICMLEA